LNENRIPTQEPTLTSTRTKILARKVVRAAREDGPEGARLSGSGPAFGAYIRTIPEIPALVVDAHGSNVLRNKRNFGVTPDLDNAALAYDNLFEASTVLKLHCDDLVSDTGFRSSFQLIETGFRNRK
jgi:hypothetical protein